MSGTAESGTYPGNPSLPREVRDKILSTFRHTLNLFKEGKSDDCVIGCDFILKMDPRFGPARQLMEKARNPAAAVDVAGLEALVALTPTRQERVASVETDRLLVRAAESFNARDFDAAIAAAEQVMQVLPGNQDAMQVLEKARRKKSAAPQFEAARQRAIVALDTQRSTEARAALDKMRSLDAEHPAVALLERKLAASSEIGESTNPGFSLPRARESDQAAGGIDDLSLDSLSLDEPMGGPGVPPPADLGDATGPLSLSGRDFGSAGTPDSEFSSAYESSIPPNLWSEPAEDLGGLSLDPAPATAAPLPPLRPSFSEPEPPSPKQEIDSLLTRGDDAVRSGNRQQAIEIWSRIFLIDINNSEAVGRIEKARQEMAEGNRRVAEELKKGRQSFEAGDFSGAREAFLQVLAADESDATARSYLDRIEQELARPSAGLDLSRKAQTGDILDEEMAQAAEPEVAEEPESRLGEREARTATAPRRTLDKRFVLALGGALVLAVAVGAYLFLRPSQGKSTPAAPGGGASLEHATMLFRDGKVTETIAELRQIPPENSEYARAQKLLASLTRKADDSGAAAGATDGTSVPRTASTGPSPDAIRQRDEGNKALADKRYIDALKSFNLAAASFQEDPTFAQAMGVASEKVNELTPAVKLYNEGEYETAIPIFWRIFQADRANRDARSYLVRSYYNQGVGQLQNGLFAKAVESFNEVLSVDPQDAEAGRHKKFAERYLKGDLDLMGRIYVRHVQQRA